MKFLPLFSATALSIASFTAGAAEPLTLPLWPDGPPSVMPAKSEATEKLIKSYGGATSTRLSDITNPTITLYRPKQPNGAAVVVVAPGGGFMFLS